MKKNNDDNDPHQSDAEWYKTQYTEDQIRFMERLREKSNFMPALDDSDINTTQEITAQDMAQAGVVRRDTDRVKPLNRDTDTLIKKVPAHKKRKRIDTAEIAKTVYSMTRGDLAFIALMPAVIAVMITIFFITCI
jgi:hypothetical protein